MVHALDEIHRILVPHGILVDLRPVLDRWPVEVARGSGYRRIGRLSDLPGGLADDQAADRAMGEAARRNWFILEQEERFSLFYSWDTPSEMEQYLREQWDSFVRLDDDVSRATKSAWAVAEADARVRVRAGMILNRWRKAG